MNISQNFVAFSEHINFDVIPFDFQQVASILRQAGQDSIRLVVARPVDPSVPQFALNSTIVPTKVLTDPQGTVIQIQ